MLSSGKCLDGGSQAPISGLCGMTAMGDPPCVPTPTVKSSP